MVSDPSASTCERRPRCLLPAPRPCKHTPTFCQQEYTEAVERRQGAESAAASPKQWTGRVQRGHFRRSVFTRLSWIHWSTWTCSAAVSRKSLDARHPPVIQPAPLERVQPGGNDRQVSTYACTCNRGIVAVTTRETPSDAVV